MRRRSKQIYDKYMVVVLVFAVCTITLVHVYSNWDYGGVHVERLSRNRHSSTFWVPDDRGYKDNDGDQSLHGDKFYRLEYSSVKVRDIQAKYPRLKTFINEPAVDSSTVSAILQSLLFGATWIFTTKENGIPPNFVNISEITNKLTQFGMVYCRPGIFEPCRHLVDPDELSIRHNKEKISDYYVVRRISALSVRVLLDSDGCMVAEKSPSVVIMPGTYAAVSFYNALLHRDLFWMSIIHLLNDSGQSSLRYLSVFLQRLLWETEHHVILIRPHSSNGEVKRVFNHSQGRPQCKILELSDWDEAIEDFALRLSNIRCKHEHFSFLQCALELVDLSFSSHVNKIRDLKSTLDLWFKTLDYIGYDFPKRVAFTKNKLKQTKWGIPAMFSAPKSEPYFHLQACFERRPTTGNAQEKQNHHETENIDISIYDIGAAGLENDQDRSETKVEPNGNNDTSSDLLDLLDAEKRTDVVENEFTGLCRSVNTVYKPKIPEAFKFDDILLIVVFNYPYLVAHIPKLLTMYGRHFQHILFCGEKIHSFGKYYSSEHNVRVSFVQINHQQGHWAYSCTAAAIKMGYNTSGFLQISDDMLLNVWNLQVLPRDKPWFQPRVRVADVRMRRLPDIATTSRWFPWIFGAGRLASRLVLSTLRQLAQDKSIGWKVQRFLGQLKRTSGCGDCLMYEASDIFYVPRFMKDDFVLFADLFHLHRLHLELAVPSILFGLVEEHQVVRLRGNYLWGEGPRAQFLKFYSPHDHFQHAWKLTRLVHQSGDGGGSLRFFCRVFLPKVEGDLVKATDRGNTKKKV